MIAEALPRSTGLHIATRNRCRLEGGLVRMELTQGYETVIDMADLRRVAPYRWHAVVTKTGHVYAESKVYAAGHWYMHRLLTDAPPGVVVRHENGDALDNRQGNLRAAGVYFHRYHSHGHEYTYWRASYRQRGKVVLLRLFPYSPEGRAWAERWLAEQRANLLAEG